MRHTHKQQYKEGKHSRFFLDYAYVYVASVNSESVCSCFLCLCFCLSRCCPHYPTQMPELVVMLLVGSWVKTSFDVSKILKTLNQ